MPGVPPTCPASFAHCFFTVRCCSTSFTPRWLKKLFLSLFLSLSLLTGAHTVTYRSSLVQNCPCPCLAITHFYHQMFCPRLSRLHSCVVEPPYLPSSGRPDGMPFSLPAITYGFRWYPKSRGPSSVSVKSAMTSWCWGGNAPNNSHGSNYCYVIVVVNVTTKMMMTVTFSPILPLSMQYVV